MFGAQLDIYFRCRAMLHGGIMINLNDEMKATADYAIKSAKEKFGQDLDFSEQSLSRLEILLSRVNQSSTSRVRDEKTNLAISRIANIWGAYFGELIRYKFGGSWVLEGSERRIKVNGFEFSPINFIFQKITNHPEYNTRDFLVEINKKISPLQTEQPQHQKKPESANPPRAQIPTRKQTNTVAVDKKVVFAFAGISSLLLVTAACIVGFFLLRGNGISKEFRSNLNNFLVEAEKLNVMTEQGVSNRDFRNQLAEVKSAYSILNGSWPSSLSTEKSVFDQAIKGWELTLEVWDYGLDESMNTSLQGYNDALLQKCSDYTNSDLENVWFNTADDWIGILMGTASQYFEQGQTSINIKLK